MSQTALSVFPPGGVGSNASAAPYRHKSLRNANINYRSGRWSVSIQVAKNKSIFGAIVGEKAVLNDLGRAVEEYWRALPAKYPELELFDFVVMPNHFHALLRIHFAPTNHEHHLGFLMSRFKGGTSFLYRLQVMDGKNCMWDSGTMTGAVSVGIAYAGEPLRSARKYEWSVRVKDERGVWSSPARSTFSTGVLKAGYVHPFKVRQACTYAVPAAFDSPYGRIESAWRYDGDGRWVWTFAIPANTKARVEAPGQTPRECGPGRYEITL